MSSERLQAFKFELMPDGGQARLLGRFSGACRFVYNRALSLQKERHEAGEKKLGYAALCRALTEWRHAPETAWLELAPVHAQQQALKDLERAYTNFFAGRGAFPKFKARGRGQGLRFPDPKQFKLDQPNARVYIPKVGWVRYRKSRNVLGDLRNITVTECLGRWYVSIQTAREVAIPVHREQQREIGIDMGARKDWALLFGQDGAMVKTLNAYRTAEHRLKHYQRCLLRKKKGSKNRAKARYRLAKCHQRVANTRSDFLHKVSNHLTRDYGVVCIEDLKVQVMTAAKVNPRQRNKAILDQGWFMLRTLLEYKAQWRGGLVVAVDPAHTSTTCSVCGHNDPGNRKSPDKFECLRCGHADQADKNAAENIRRAGQARIACGEHVRHHPGGAGSTKQEPNEATLPGSPG
ncbi:RNA-guided endonuclease InsQ/TnpB family protein [Hydrogenophaga sp. NFH-34]|uniref:RNA-guided endonuclease InsQ/TnpB family protein n=1 Tax=Hydrogenophaga sp. NFH-34 TaxID=2744446 RepID=UPI001F227C36|nr:transposase [Hydrogenophaga sp. NFH-34]